MFDWIVATSPIKRCRSDLPIAIWRDRGGTNRDLEIATSAFLLINVPLVVSLSNHGVRRHAAMVESLPRYAGIVT